ncbi:TPA: SAM-dependent methyltransferase, partial [Legionella pneumophila]|nr:SAM-dependent methyltransferase [Legionella pneumophila]
MRYCSIDILIIEFYLKFGSLIQCQLLAVYTYIINFKNSKMN